MRRILVVVPVLALLAAPVHAANPATARQVELSRLLDALPDAPDEASAAALELRIRLLRQQAASPAAKLLLERGDRDLQANAFSDALDDYSAALTLDPDLPDGLLRRAQARIGAGRYAAALSDLESVLVREPRDFVALTLLAQLAEARGDWPGALAAWRKLLAVDPKTPGGQARLEKLRLKAEGEPT